MLPRVRTLRTTRLPLGEHGEMLMLKWIAPLGVMMIAGCGSSHDEAPSRTEIDAQVEVLAKQTVREQLKDPDSAEFSEFRISARNHTFSCGKVNSKNGFGGMGGSQRFVVSAIGVAFMEEAVLPAEMDELWAKYC